MKILWNDQNKVDYNPDVEKKKIYGGHIFLQIKSERCGIYLHEAPFILIPLNLNI